MHYSVYAQYNNNIIIKLKVLQPIKFQFILQKTFFTPFEDFLMYSIPCTLENKLFQNTFITNKKHSENY